MERITESKPRHQAPETLGPQHHSGIQEAERNGHHQLRTLLSGHGSFCVTLLKVQIPRGRINLVHFGSTVYPVARGSGAHSWTILPRRSRGLYCSLQKTTSVNARCAKTNGWLLHMGVPSWQQGLWRWMEYLGQVGWSRADEIITSYVLTVPAHISMSQWIQGWLLSKKRRWEGDRNRPSWPCWDPGSNIPLPLPSSCQQTAFTESTVTVSLWPPIFYAPSITPQSCFWEAAAHPETFPPAPLALR